MTRRDFDKIRECFCIILSWTPYEALFIKVKFGISPSPEIGVRPIASFLFEGLKWSGWRTIPLP